MSAAKILICAGCALLLTACIAPITPPPGPQSQPPSIPSPSSGGLPSPSSMPPSTPGAPPSAPSPPGSSNSPSSPSPPGPTGGGEIPSRDESQGGGSSDSSPGESVPAWEPSEGGGSPSDEDSWEDGEAGSGSNDGWETSNQPGGSADVPPMPSEQSPTSGGPDGDFSESGGDGEFNDALEDFDGEILAEREVIRTRSNEGGPGVILPTIPTGSTSSSDSTRRSPGGATSMPRNRNPAPVPGASGPVPEDLPDAKDDDIIARQLREAAMQETDPILKEKLWDEYRRYHGA